VDDADRPEIEPRDIEELIAAAKADPHEALGRLFDLYHSQLWLLSHHSLPNDLRGLFSTSDLVQETYLRAQANFSQFRGRSGKQFWAWLSAIGHHVIFEIHRHYSALRRDRARDLLGQADHPGGFTDQPDPEQPPPDVTAVRREETERIRSALRQLPSECARIIRWRAAGLNFEKIGRRLGKSAVAARQQWVRSVCQLRSMVWGSGEWEGPFERT
jgi:RNA polymerase sigma factor (sigma-70 family)